MNNARTEGNKKIAEIVRRYRKQWESMTKEELIAELAEEKTFFLETELEYGNDEYLDELLEE